MFQNITEFLNSTNTMTTAVTLAAGGYILNLLKVVPLRIISMIRERCTKSIYATSDRYDVFSSLEAQVFKDYKLLFENHIHAEPSKVPGMDNEHYSISPGFYTKIDWKNLSIVSVSKSETNITNYYARNDAQDVAGCAIYKLSIAVFGLKSDNILSRYKLIINDYMNGLLYDHDKFVRVASSKGGYWGDDVSFVLKKNTNNIYDNKAISIINKHVDAFVANENIYNKIGDVYKTGILLHGKPGTGKSCLAKFIASKLNAHVYVAKSIERMTTIPNIRGGKFRVILIEEIDKFITSVRFGESGMKPVIDESKVSELLQLMDGIESPNRTIFVATSNDISKLPDALLRKGRFDLVLEMNGIERSDAENMCRGFGFDPEEVLKDFPLDDGLYNPAELRNKLILKMYNN